MVVDVRMAKYPNVCLVWLKKVLNVLIQIPTTTTALVLDYYNGRDSSHYNASTKRTSSNSLKQL